MKIQNPENENYAATVVRVRNINPLENCDNVVGVPVFGFQAIVSKDTQVGDLGIVFPAEVQLSEKFASENNLFRHSEKNKNSEAKGYIEDNRRVKAVKFRGHRSDCLLMPLNSLKFTGVNPEELHEGDTFDTLNGNEICRKYVIKQKTQRLDKNKEKQKFVRVDKKFMPEHYDTENYWKNQEVIPSDREVIVTQKLHGTSIRIGNTLVRRKLSLRDRIAKRFGVKIKESEYDNIYGSRKVIKDINNPNQDHFYGTDIWSEEGRKRDDVVPEGFLIYGELIGWTPDNEPIQKSYTYKVPQGTCHLYVYRVAFVNGQGRVVDLSWDQVKEFCLDSGLLHVPELWRGKHEEFNADDFIDKRLINEGYTQAVPLEDKKGIVDEGVCVRVDGLAPYILKAKSPIFLQHESKMLDQEVPDLESDGSGR